LSRQAIEIRAFLFCPETAVSQLVARSMESQSGVTILRSFPYYPNAEEAGRLVRIYAPNCVILSVADLPEAGRLAEEVRKSLPGVQFIAVHDQAEPSMLLQVIRLGIQEFLSPPFRHDIVAESLLRVRTQLSTDSVLAKGTNLVYSFLPAKPGVGTTTLAVNTAIAAARITADPVFFGDFDLSNGVVRFMLKLDSERSVVDAASTDEVDESTWSKLICRKFGVDFMHAGRLQPDTRVSPIQAQRLIEFLRRPYKIVFADLSGNFEKYSIEIMRQSRRIFLVTTPELPALYLARDRVAYLNSLDLGDRVTVLLNRAVKRSSIDEKDISSLLGLPVFRTFANDYMSVAQALQDANPVKENSELGRQIAEFARMIPDEQSMKKPEPAKKFLEFFTLNPSRGRA